MKIAVLWIPAFNIHADGVCVVIDDIARILSENTHGRFRFFKIDIHSAIARHALGRGAAKEAVKTPDAQVKNMVAKIDANGDGSLSMTEFDSFRTRMEDAIKKQMDTAAASQ